MPSYVESLTEYISAKCSEDVSVKASLKKGCLTIYFKAPGMSKRFYENVAKKEIAAIAPDWVFQAKESPSGDLTLSLPFTEEETRNVFSRPLAKTREMFGDDVVAIINKIPAKTVQALWGPIAKGC